MRAARGVNGVRHLPYLRRSGRLLPPDVVDARLLFLLKKLDRRPIAVYSRLTLSPRSASVHTGKSVPLAMAACFPVPTPPASPPRCRRRTRWS